MQANAGRARAFLGLAIAGAVVLLVGTWLWVRLRPAYQTPTEGTANEPATVPVTVEASADPWVPPPLSTADPIDWSPPAELPPLRRLISDAEYARRRDPVAAKVDLKAIEGGAKPALTIRLWPIDPAGMAARLGITASDQITTLDGIPVRSVKEFAAARRPTTQALGVWLWGGTPKTITIDPGPLGAGGLPYWNCDAAYVQTGPRAPAWDADMLAAAAAVRDDPGLAETALAHAQQAGYRGYALPAMASAVAMWQGRLDDSLAFRQAALANCPAEYRPALAGEMYAAALLTWHYDLALKLARDYPQLNIDAYSQAMIEELARQHRAAPWRPRSNPIADLPALQEREMFDEIQGLTEGLDDVNTKWSAWVAQQLHQTGAWRFDVEAGHFLWLCFTPAVPNVDFEAEFSFHPSDQKQTPWGRVVCFGLYDQARKGAPLLLRLVIYDNGMISVERPGLPECSVGRAPRVGVDDTGHVRIVLLDQRCEVVLDGRRVFYGPVFEDERTRAVGLMMQTVGVAGSIHNISWKAIEPSP